MNKKLILSGILFCLSPSIFANNTYVEDGLSLVKVSTGNSISSPTENITNNPTTIKIPNDLLTIGQSINYILIGTGYSLEERHNFEPEVRRVLMQEIPNAQRSFSIATTDQIIRALLGKKFKTEYDNVNRKLKITYTK